MITMNLHILIKNRVRIGLFLAAVVVFYGNLGMTVLAAAPRGSMTCSTTTSNSITIGLSYDNTTAGASAVGLYRSGVLAASYPGTYGIARHVDNGLNGTYQYQLRSGSTVLANVQCATMPAPQPAPAPAPAAVSSAPMPASVTTQPTAPVAAAPVIEQVVTPAPAATEPEPVVKVGENANDNPTVATTQTPAAGSKSGLVNGIALGLAAVLALGAAFYYVLIRRRRPLAVKTAEAVAISEVEHGPLSLPEPVAPQKIVTTPKPVPLVAPKPAIQSSKIEANIDKAFYPSRPVEATAAPVVIDDTPDMFTIAHDYPASFGNSQYQPTAPKAPDSPPPFFVRPPVEPTGTSKVNQQ